MTKSNEINEQCYCSNSRNFEKHEIQCIQCATWFHLECITIDIGPLAKFMMNYQFNCKKCNNNQESFTKKQASFHQLCVTTLANLTYDSRNNEPPKIFFSSNRDIIPFIDQNWEALTNAPRRVKPTWHATISRSMTREDVFQTTQIKGDIAETLHGLKDLSYEKIGPFNDQNKLVLGSSRLANDGRQSAEISSSSKRGSKRKANDSSSSGSSYGFGGSSGSSSKKKGLNESTNFRLEKAIPSGIPLDHPFNKDGYRYHLVEPDPHSPLRTKFEETEYWAGKPIPGSLYRLYLETKVALSLHDRAPQLKLSDDRLSVQGEKGYSMARATHGVLHGSWYFEVIVSNMPNVPNKSALRIGWAQHLANLQAPCGYDKFSYSWRSRKGTVFHESIGKSYSRQIDTENENKNSGYGAGDVLGFYINLPLENKKTLLRENLKKMNVVKSKNHLYFEEKDYFKEAESRLKPLKGSEIAFFKNGKCHGIAYKDVYEGVYYPAVSIYQNANVTMNFGPNFKYPIDDDQFKARPICELANDTFIEHSLSDLIHHVTHDEDNNEKL